MSLPKRWKRDESGVAATEFALLATPFFFLILGLLETTLFFAAGSLMEGMAQHASRVVRTGAAQQSADPLQTFIDRMCEYDSSLLRCEDVTFEVVPALDFAEAEQMAPAFDADGNLVSQGFDPGGASDVVLIRMAYTYNFKTPLLAQIVSSGGNNSALLMSSVVLRNEPYDFE